MSKNIYIKSIDSNQNSCAFCHKETNNPKFCSLKCSGSYYKDKAAIMAVNLSKKRTMENQKAYNQSPKQCLYCGKTLPYISRHNTFCDRVCSSYYTNKQKPKKVKNTQKRVSPKLGQFQSQIVGPYTKVYLCKCKYTGKLWYSPTVKTIHPSTIVNKQQYSYLTRFTFNPALYPDWFVGASELIKMYGWYSASNRNNNLDGCSRDHLYSVSDGFRNKVDPKILSHPANCRIIPHKENQKKRSKSSITLEELLQRIDKFTTIYEEFIE